MTTQEPDVAPSTEDIARGALAQIIREYRGTAPGLIAFDAMKQILAIESAVGVWWLHFTDEAGDCIGVVMTEATDFTDAVTRSHEQGINPGGQVDGAPCGARGTVPAGYLDRLISDPDEVTLVKAGPPDTWPQR